MTRDIGKLGETQELTEPEHSRPAQDRTADAKPDDLADPRESPGTGDSRQIAGSVVSYEVVFEERKGKHWESYGSMTETAVERTDSPGEGDRLDTWHAERRQPAEQRVTPDLQSFEAADLGHLEGLQHCFKGQHRLMEKVNEAMLDEGYSRKEALDEIFDSLRYTLTLPDDNYSAGVRQAMDDLHAKGYELRENGFKNFWGGDTYKGINVQLRTPDGFPMELQFHTATSFYVKEELTHDLYERRRDPHTGEDEKVYVDELQADISERVPIPEGALDLRYPPTGEVQP